MSVQLRNQKLAELRNQREKAKNKNPHSQETEVKPGLQISEKVEKPVKENLENPFFLPDKEESSEPVQLNIENPEINRLQSLISKKIESIQSLQSAKSSFLLSNASIKSSVKSSLVRQSEIREIYTSKRKDLESTISLLVSKLGSPEDLASDPQVSNLSELRRTVENQKKLSLEKEANIRCLKKDLEYLNSEISKLRGAAPSFVPDPPGEDVIIDSSYRNLISDVGSTGNLLKRSEEVKGPNYASPDPLEGNMPQSTGETKYVGTELYQGAATPPNESNSLDHYDLPYIEESKEPGTPKRDASNPRDSSGSSTPRRYRDSNPALVHNLLGSIHNTNSEEEPDFFSTLTRDKRKQDTLSKSPLD